MKTIDDLQFPETDKPSEKVVLPWDVKLPGKPVIRAGTEIELWHTGVRAMVKIGEEVWSF